MRKITEIIREKALLIEAAQKGTLKKAGVIVFAAVFLAAVAAISGKPVKTGELTRPANGTGGEGVSLEVIGADVSDKLDFSIPEKELTGAEKEAILDAACNYIREYFEKLGVVCGPGAFPDEYGRAQFGYASKSPEMIDYKGNFVGSRPNEEFAAEFDVTVWVEDYKSVETVRVVYAAAGELSAEEQLNIVESNLKKGLYTDETSVKLPPTLFDGSALAWRKSEGQIQPAAVLFFGFAVAVFYVVHCMKKPEEAEKKRILECENGFSDFINRFLLYVRAGDSIENTLIRCADETEGAIQKELTEFSNNIHNGKSFADSMDALVERMPVGSMRELGRLAVMQRRYGDREFADRIERLNREAEDEKKNAVIKKSKKAETALLIPLVILLAVVLAVVISPAMFSLKA